MAGLRNRPIHRDAAGGQRLEDEGIFSRLYGGWMVGLKKSSSGIKTRLRTARRSERKSTEVERSALP